EVAAVIQDEARARAAVPAHGVILGHKGAGARNVDGRAGAAIELARAGPGGVAGDVQGVAAGHVFEGKAGDVQRRARRNHRGTRAVEIAAGPGKVTAHGQGAGAIDAAATNLEIRGGRFVDIE